MPRLPRVKDRTFIGALVRLGFFEHVQGPTSHRIFKHNDGKRIVVAIHPGKDIPHGTLIGTLRDAQISREQFLKALEK